MDDLLIALLISGVGSFLMVRIDAANATAQQKASCSSQGGTWGTPNAGICNGGQPVNNSGYTEWGNAIDLGVPLLAGALVTRSVGGVAGAVLGAAINVVLGFGL